MNRKIRAQSPINHYIEQTSLGYNLHLYKEIPQSTLSKAINSKVMKIKENNYRPTYNMVTDIYGNQYFVEENDMNDDELIREAMNQIDIDEISNQAARESFKEYEIELNRRGDEIQISSVRDNFYKEFEIDENIEDFNVSSCSIERNHDGTYIAVLKIYIRVSSPNWDIKLDHNHTIEPAEVRKLNSKPLKRRRLTSGKAYNNSKRPISSSYCNRGDIPRSFENSNNKFPSPPILEEIQDAEEYRYNEALNRTPTGSYIIEDI